MYTVHTAEMFLFHHVPKILMESA